MNRPPKSGLQAENTWKKYSAASLALAAAGVATQEVNGAILYTGGVNLTISNSSSGVLYFDLDHSGSNPYAGISLDVPGSADFALGFNDPEEPVLDIWTSYADTAGQPAFPKFFLGQYAANATIGSSLSWNAPSLPFLEYYGNGSWEGGGMGFAALRIETAGGGSYNYGWARITYDDAAVNPTMTLVDFAYETTLNQSIAAGDTGSGVVPEPSRALLLALGIGGALLRRRRQKA